MLTGSRLLLLCISSGNILLLRLLLRTMRRSARIRRVMLCWDRVWWLHRVGIRLGPGLRLLLQSLLLSLRWRLCLLLRLLLRKAVRSVFLIHNHCVLSKMQSLVSHICTRPRHCFSSIYLQRKEDVSWFNIFLAFVHLFI